MRMAIVGCGYVANFYMAGLVNHPELRLLGAFDRDPDRLDAFSRYHSTRAYDSLADVLADDDVELVLNLTNPRSHYEVTAACIEAGRHVYTEKPLAMDAAAAQQLLDLADQQGVRLGTAPCSVLGETAQTMWKALTEGVVGRVRLIYANYEAGMIPRLRPSSWRSKSGAPWPAKDEFEVGCTYEHAGYVLTWLAAFFGPARSVTAFSSCLLPDKGVEVDGMAPDFTVGCIEYDDGIVARVTCGIVAPEEKSLTVVGDKGVLFTRELRNDAGPVYVTDPYDGRTRKIRKGINLGQSWLERHLNWIPGSWSKWELNHRYPLARKPRYTSAGRRKPVDFCRGPAELAAAIRDDRPCRLSGALGVHITELVEALQYPERIGGTRKIESTFDPIEPLSWDR